MTIVIGIVDIDQYSNCYYQWRNDIIIGEINDW